jgi:hypothetical protein
MPHARKIVYQKSQIKKMNKEKTLNTQYSILNDDPELATGNSQLLNPL